jgi:preprotein translocase subunit YajC
MRDQEIIDLWEAYQSIYSNLSESHFKVGDEVICKASGMEGKVVKVDPEEKGKYYTVKREDGKTMKYAPDELKLEDEDEEKEDEEKEDEKEDVKEAKNGGASKKEETKFHTKLDKLVHKTFGSSPEEKKMKEEVELDEEAPKRIGLSPASPRLMRNAGPARVHDPSKPSASKMVKRVDEETDLFDYILEHLVAEGYADTNEAALAIMANMGEEWRQSILESGEHVGREPKTVGGRERDPNVKPGSRKGKTYGERQSDMKPGAQSA